ncbi:pseudouridine synthase [Acinetobacter stercoris]|nr:MULTISPECIES: pseudouridine synthase [Acinetobacter]
MIDGVSASKVYLPQTHKPYETIYQYLCEKFSHIQPIEWQQRFQDGLIFDFNGSKLSLDTQYTPNIHIYYYRFLVHEIHVPFHEKILFENDDLLVVDKPHFLTMSPTGQYIQETLLVRLKKQTGNEYLTPIHRLDRETAGVVLFSKKVESRGLYQQMFANRLVQKSYHAIAPFRKDLKFPLQLSLKMEKGTPFYTMQVLDGTPNSQTDIEVLEHNDQWAKYKLTPHTGKQHQLRVHMNHLNIPIKNDPFYPIIDRKKADDFTQPLQLLAKEISFKDPIIKENFYFHSNLVLTL